MNHPAGEGPMRGEDRKISLSRKTMAGLAMTAVLVIAAIAVALLPSGTATPELKAAETMEVAEEPIVGKWRAVAVVASGETIPIMDGSFLRVTKNGAVELSLDGAYDATGTWKKSSYPASDGVPYELSFDDGSTAVLLYRDGNVFVGIESIMICFEP